MKKPLMEGRQIRMEAGVYNSLKKIALLQETTVSEIIRRLVSQYVKKWSGK